jgi:hypothetical protein
VSAIFICDAVYLKQTVFFSEDFVAIVAIIRTQRSVVLSIWFVDIKKQK